MTSFSFIVEMAELRIEAAIKEGAFDNLPGKGKPLFFEDDSLVPEDCRMAYKILKNSGHVPPARGGAAQRNSFDSGDVV